MDVKPRSLVSSRELRLGCAALAACVWLLAGCGKSPEEVKAAKVAEIAQTTGRLAIKSNRANTTIEATREPAAGETAPTVVKGVDEGAAEHAFAGLPPGKYVVIARSAGWAELREEANVVAGGTAEVAFHFKSGALRLESDPAGALVKLGNAVLGKTPLTVPQMPLGEIELTLEYPAWPAVRHRLTINENAETAGDVRLPHGKLTVDSFPAGATIAMDGRTLGQTPLVVERFPAGTKKLTLQTREFPPAEVTVTVEDKGETATAPVLANGFPILEPASLLRTVWFDPSSGAVNRTSLAGFQSRNGIVKNLDRKKLFVDWLGKKFRFGGVVSGYNPQTGEIGFGEQKGELARYRVTAKLSAAARANKELVAQLTKGGTFALYATLGAVEEPEWPARHIAIEFTGAEPLQGGLPSAPPAAAPKN